MFQTGLIDEVRGILARGFAASAKPFESHGYRQAVQVLNGELNAGKPFSTRNATRDATPSAR